MFYFCKINRTKHKYINYYSKVFYELNFIRHITPEDREVTFVLRNYLAEKIENKDLKQKFENLTYLDVLSKDLKVMDASAISLARENKIPIVVCSIVKNKNLTKVLSGEGSYTIISD